MRWMRLDSRRVFAAGFGTPDTRRRARVFQAGSAANRSAAHTFERVLFAGISVDTWASLVNLCHCFHCGCGDTHTGVSTLETDYMLSICIVSCMCMISGCAMERVMHLLVASYVLAVLRTAPGSFVPGSV